jgi:hypothetical protein
MLDLQTARLLLLLLHAAAAAAAAVMHWLTLTQPP